MLPVRPKAPVPAPARRSCMSRERDPLVTMSAAKRTFATKNARALWTLDWGRKHDGRGLRISDVLTPIRAGVMGSGRDCQPDGWLRHLERGDTLVVVPHQARASPMRCQVQGREPVRGSTCVGKAPRPGSERPLPDARRTLHWTKDRRGPQAHSTIEPLAINEPVVHLCSAH